MARKRKQVSDSKEVDAVTEIPTVRQSDEPPAKKPKWTNRQRVLLLGSRGMAHRHRHFMNDIKSFMPHCKSEGKKESKDELSILNEICEIRNCNKCIYFECRKLKDLYMWFSNTPHGPSVKFLVTNIHTMGELKFSGNCLQGTRPLLSFDDSFNKPHWSLMRELITHIFNTPNQHPKSQPFVDHVFTFAVVDGKIWFRNFQIVEEDGQLTEIGPRFVLDPIKVFDGSFGGATLWSSENFVTPNSIRSQQKELKAVKFINRTHQGEKKKKKAFRPGQHIFRGDPTSAVFEEEEENTQTKSLSNGGEQESEQDEYVRPKGKKHNMTSKAKRKMITHRNLNRINKVK